MWGRRGGIRIIATLSSLVGKKRKEKKVVRSEGVGEGEPMLIAE